MDNLLVVSPEDGFFKKLVAFNQMATRTIESNKITGIKAVVVRFSVILDSISLFKILINQKRMMTASMYGLIKIVEIQKRLNENGVAYTFPVGTSAPPQEPKGEKEYLKKVLSKIDHTKMEKN